MLSQVFIASMKERLLADKVRLERDLEDLAKKDPQNPSHYEPTYPEFGGSSEDDNSAEVANYADEISLVKRLEDELRDTVHALTAIEGGTYGTCKYCQKEIDMKRLEARPTSSACIACKKLLTQEM